MSHSPSAEHLGEHLLLALLLPRQQLREALLRLLEVGVLRRGREPLLEVPQGHVELAHLLVAEAPAEDGLDVGLVEVQHVVAGRPRLLVVRLRPVLPAAREGGVRGLDVALRAVEVAGDLDLLRLLGLIGRAIRDHLRAGHVLDRLLVPPDRVVELLRLEHVVALLLVLSGQSEAVLLLHRALVLVEVHAELLAALPLLGGRLLQGLLLLLALLLLRLEEGGALGLDVRLHLLHLRGIGRERSRLLGHVHVLEPEDDLVEVGAERVGLQQRAVLAVQPVADLVDVGLQRVALLEARHLLRVHGVDLPLALPHGGEVRRWEAAGLREGHGRDAAPARRPGGGSCGDAGGSIEAEAERARLARRGLHQRLHGRHAAAAAHDLDALDGALRRCGDGLGQHLLQLAEHRRGGGLQHLAREVERDVDLGAVWALGHQGLEVKVGVREHAQLLEGVDHFGLQPQPGLALRLHLALVLVLDALLGLAEERLDEGLHAHALVGAAVEEVGRGAHLGSLLALGGGRARVLHHGHGAVGHADVDEGDGPLVGPLRQEVGALALREGGGDRVGLAQDARLGLEAGDVEGVAHDGELLVAHVVVDGHAELFRHRGARGVRGERPEERRQRAAGLSAELVAVEGDRAQLPVLGRE
mmetsp:Transcript_57254/g.168100  ORF Transcript_57254/g.168100 Transcript_57254/m.168100 type:complete len:642 (-) Transcript_57254:86-2011(-)